MTSLRTWARFAGITAFEDYLGPTPLKAMPHPLPGGIEDVYKLIDVANKDQHKALISMCGLMGTRISEALAATPDWYNLREKTCTIVGKRDKRRIVPVSSRAWDNIAVPLTAAWIDGRRIIQFEDRFARQLITNLGERAGLSRHISSHDLRHTFATHVYATTNDIRLVQELLGHESINTTQIYTEIFIETARRAVEF